MRRREFIGLLGAAMAWPVAARAQQPQRVPRIGVLMQIAADDPEAQARLGTFRAHLEQLGWTDKRNVQIDARLEIAPSIKRVGVLRDPALTLGTAQFAAIQAMAPTVGVEVAPLGGRDAGEIERGIGEIARTSNAGLVLTGSSWTVVHRHLIITLAARHKLPAVDYERYFVTDGGLISYGPRFVDQFRQQLAT